MLIVLITVRDSYCWKALSKLGRNQSFHIVIKASYIAFNSCRTCNLQDVGFELASVGPVIDAGNIQLNINFLYSHPLNFLYSHSFVTNSFKK